MTATVPLDDTEHKPDWVLSVDNGNWEVRSPFGSVETAVVLDADGVPVFDRPLYREAPNVNLVVWGIDEFNEVKLAIIRQPRPHADDPEQPGINGHKPIVFGQIPMGFVEKIFGESLEDAAMREAHEETGVTLIKSVTRPHYPHHNPNPTFVATWSELLFVEVDLSQIEKVKSTRDEPIFSAEFISAKELISRIAGGVDSAGAVYRMCTANSALFIFFATYPEYWPR
jgi:hypothetical protein